MPALVERLRDVDRKYPEVADRINGYRIIFEGERGRNPFLNDAIDNPSLLIERSDAIENRFDGWHAYKPSHASDEEIRQIKELDGIIGHLAGSDPSMTANLHDNLSNNYGNALVIGAASTVAGAVLGAREDRPPKLSRRKLIRKVSDRALGGMLFAGSLGTIAGWIISGNAVDQIRDARRSAYYVTERIYMVYR